MRLYGTIPAKWVDPWGDEHHVDMVVEVVNVARAGRFPHNNGYETTDNAVFVADSGVTYLSVPPIDFGASAYYLRNPPSALGRVRWRSRPPKRCIGKDGQPFNESAQADEVET